MTTYVLVHGSYQGGWIWKLVAQRLEQSGHQVYRPTLDGSAERRRTGAAGLTLEQHGAELADLLFYEDLQDAVLVGTSIGGMVVAQAAPSVHERIRRLVFIDALVPLPGESGDWAAARYTQQAIGPTDDPVDLRDFWSRSWQVDVLRCTRSPLPPEVHQRRTAERLHGTYAEIDAGHYSMLSHPQEIADYLIAR